MLVSLPNSFGDAATNMAIDASLLETIPAGHAVIRHYGWTEPSVTFGYSQNYAEVAAEFGLTDSGSLDRTPAPLMLCRRLSGGGIVDHRDDWTYALILHASLAAARLPATELYAKTHTSLCRALEICGQAAQLAPCPSVSTCGRTEARSRPVQNCFNSPTANDVLCEDGRKIAGAAMKRRRGALLLQGSIDRGRLPRDFNWREFQSRFTSQIAQSLVLTPSEKDDVRPFFDGGLIQRERARFSSSAWNRRR